MVRSRTWTTVHQDGVRDERVMERSRPIERLADALQECLNEATERGANKAVVAIKEELTPHLDRQNETLRLT